jgi:RNA polymerase sigma factor (sigma-70 family)|tara:strand:+ start:431 stop:982 length:552 start_codon:yes stop_codon:yes gene_type:complete
LSEQHHILRLIAEGNQLSFRQLYDLYNKLVYNTALSFVPNVSSAEEITQDVFTKIYRKAGSFKGGSTVKTWIFRITVNTALNQIKKNKKARTINLETCEKIDFDHPGILLENREDAVTLQRAIGSLPETQRTAFVLCYIEDLPRLEAASIMGVSLKAIESLLQRAKGNLRKKLEKLYPHRRKK